MAKFKVTLTTSDIPNAGTDAAVSISLYGIEPPAQTHAIRLAAPGKKLFKRGMVDTLEVEGAMVGELGEIHVSHDGRGLAPSWHLQDVSVVTIYCLFALFVGLLCVFICVFLCVVLFCFVFVCFVCFVLFCFACLFIHFHCIVE